MATVGSNIVTGVWNGICNAAGWFRDSVYNFFSNIVGNAKSALGIHSPSRVFADEVGQWIPPGITEGIESKMPDLVQEDGHRNGIAWKKNAVRGQGRDRERHYMDRNCRSHLIRIRIISIRKM